MSSSRTANKLFWVISFSDNTPPYLKTIDNIQKEFIKDSIVISAKALEEFQSFDKTEEWQQISPHVDTYLLNDLRALHQTSSRKVKAEEIDEIVGKGAFGQDIQKGDAWVYTGHYDSKEEMIHVPRKDQKYISQAVGDLLVNAKNTLNMARYFQHLPDKEEIEVLARKIRERVAQSNVAHKLVLFTFDANGKTYTMYTCVLVAIKDLKEKTLLGYSYGEFYWELFQVTPVFFSLASKPLYDICCFNVINSKNEIPIKFWLDKIDLENFLECRYKVYSDYIIMLPTFIETKPKTEIITLLFPCVYYINFNEDKCFVASSNDNKLFCFPFDESVDPNEMGIYAQSISCVLSMVLIQEKKFLTFNLKEIANLKIQDAKSLFDKINKYVGDEAVCIFDVDDSLALIEKNIAQQKIAESAAAMNKGLSVFAEGKSLENQKEDTITHTNTYNM